MNDEKNIDEMENLLADFRILATKVNENNKNKNWNLEEKRISKVILWTWSFKKNKSEQKQWKHKSK